MHVISPPSPASLPYGWIPRTLIVDHHDSYTLNLLQLFLPYLANDISSCPSPPSTISIGEGGSNEKPLDTRQHPAAGFADLLSSHVLVLPHTHPLLKPAAFKEHLLPHLDALILGPGPGSPDREADFGAATALLLEDLGLPVLGVCLGHQGLASAFGGKVRRTRIVRHGVCSELLWQPSDNPAEGSALFGPSGTIFEGIPQRFSVVRYNSLTVEEDSLPDCLQVTAWAMDTAESLAPPPANSRFSPPNNSTWPLRAPSCSTSTTERVIMGLQHRTRPYWGVQFHPESVSSDGGHAMMRNFFSLVRRHWEGRFDAEGLARQHCWNLNTPLPQSVRVLGTECVAAANESLLRPLSAPSNPSGSQRPLKRWAVTSRTFRRTAASTREDAQQVFEQLFRFGGPGSLGGSVWLDSAKRHDPHSRFSYMASPSFYLSYHRKRRQMLLESQPPAVGGRSSKTAVLMGAARTAWAFMDELQRELHAATLIETRSADVADYPPALPQQRPSSATSSRCGSPALSLSASRRSHAPPSMFRTGFVGYWGYEMRHERVETGGAPEPGPTSTSTRESRHSQADAEWGFCDRVLVIDHELDEWVAFALVNLEVEVGEYSVEPRGSLANLLGALAPSGCIGSPRAAAERWFDDVGRALHKPRPSTSTSVPTPLPPLRPRDSASTYKQKVDAAREYIAAGESYELCMTTQIHGRLDPLRASAGQSETAAVAARRQDLDHFGIYLGLRARNPAPYSAFLHFPSVTLGSDEEPVLPITDALAPQLQRGRSILCTSPERFMRISATGEVEMKPIKGTLARAGWGDGEAAMRPSGVSAKRYSAAEELEEKRKMEWRRAEDEKRRATLAADTKERAENLMIVDLIRAELLSFCAPHSVNVPALMRVESYATVHQLVTTVRGVLRPGVGAVEAQQRCHAPGSMTGAPKRRSMRILERLEGMRAAGQDMPGTRGVYSGTLGWIGIDGASDLAVVIRTAVVKGDDVSLGAGGAITYLSNPQREWTEVLHKAQALATLDLSTDD